MLKYTIDKTQGAKQFVLAGDGLVPLSQAVILCPDSSRGAWEPDLHQREYRTVDACVEQLAGMWRSSSFAETKRSLGAIEIELAFTALHRSINPVINGEDWRDIIEQLCKVQSLDSWDLCWVPDSQFVSRPTCCDPHPDALLHHAVGHAVCIRLKSPLAATAMLEAAVRLGLYGTRKSNMVHLQCVPLAAGFRYTLPVSNLGLEFPNEWRAALEAATAMTGMTYMERLPGYSGCGGTEGSDTPVSTGRVYIPEGDVSWLLHEVGHWVAATAEERRRPNYGLGSEEHGLNAAREWQAHAFESIVLAPFGNSRELTPAPAQTGVAFCKPGPIPSDHYRYIENILDQRNLWDCVERLRRVWAPCLASA